MFVTHCLEDLHVLLGDLEVFLEDFPRALGVVSCEVFSHFFELQLRRLVDATSLLDGPDSGLELLCGWLVVGNLS